MDTRGKESKADLKTTWRRTVEKEIKRMGLTWDEAEMVNWTESVGGRRWRLHTPHGAKSKRKND